MLKTTSQNLRYWAERKIDWGTHYWNPDHPHRAVLVNLLRRFKFRSVLEVGCASGANLAVVRKYFPKVEVGGIDPNPDAVEEAKYRVPGGVFETGTANNLFFSTGSVDVLLYDACLIYVSPGKIRQAMNELLRVARKGVVLCELYHPNWFVRQILRFSGYNAYDYPKRLEKLGFYDIRVHKIPEAVWEGLPWSKFGYMITAKK